MLSGCCIWGIMRSLLWLSVVEGVGEEKSIIVYARRTTWRRLDLSRSFRFASSLFRSGEDGVAAESWGIVLRPAQKKTRRTRIYIGASAPVHSLFGKTNGLKSIRITLKATIGLLQVAFPSLFITSALIECAICLSDG